MTIGKLIAIIIGIIVISVMINVSLFEKDPFIRNIMLLHLIITILTGIGYLIYKFWDAPINKKT